MTRLIDADALSKDLEKRWNVNDDQDFCNKEVWRALEEAPTIEPDAGTISRSQAIKGVSEWATDILHQDRLVKEDAIHILESLPSAEQVTGKLNNPDGSLLTADSDTCKEQKSKLDLISRQDAVNEIHKFFVAEIDKTPTEIDEDGDELYADMPTVNSLLACNKELSRRIKSLPSAPDSRQRGEWVRLEREENVYDFHGVPTWGVNYMCDKCGFITTAIQDHFAQYRWCPSCGARMYKGGEDDADE